MAERKSTIPRELEGPLDRAVRALFDVSWGKARSWIESGKVAVDGEPVREPTTRVRGGRLLAVDEGAQRPRRVGRLSSDEVVYVDAHVIVVNKPPGVSTVPYDEREVDTLEARVRGWLERRRRSGRRGESSAEDSPRPAGRPLLGVVHRIDKETSGLVVFTRTWIAKRDLALQFRNHTVERRYLAVAHGDVRSGTIRSLLVNNRGDGLRGSTRRQPPPEWAREAVTHVERLERLRGATLVACRLETGRTHQIRIHLSEAGHPIVGESVYVRDYARPLLEAPRLMLHAAELGFVHPATGRPVRWELEMPGDMRAVVEKLRG